MNKVRALAVLLVSTIMLALIVADAQASGPVWDGCKRVNGWQQWANYDVSSCGGARDMWREIRPQVHGLYPGKRIREHSLTTGTVCTVRRVVDNFETWYVDHAYRRVVVYAWQITCRGTHGAAWLRAPSEQYVKRAGWRVI